MRIPGISIHAPPRGATGHVFTYWCKRYFNSRPSARGDLTNGRPIARPTNFNSRPSARGDYPLDASNSPTFLFQFTPLREGRRGNWVRKIKTIDISIHAPPRGATPRICSADYKRGYFNSRPSARGDAGNHQKQAKKANISIHAPPRGATLQSPVKRRQATEFQFTPLREGRPLPARRFPIHSIYFNSRPSARGDKQRRYNGENQIYFNSRPSARGDIFPSRNRPLLFISIHAPPRGATFVSERKYNHG